MPARIMRQNKEIKALFREKIREKVAREKDAIRTRIDEEMTSWISWAIKPLAGIVFDQKHQRDCERGESGEDRAILNLGPHGEPRCLGSRSRKMRLAWHFY